MRRTFGPILALLCSVALLLVGHGLLLTLLPLRADTHGFSPTQVGLTGSSYFLGFVAGCLLVPRIVRGAGHIRTFAALGAVFSSIALTFEMVPAFYAWLLLRFVVGGCMAGAYMVIESWLNERATAQTRGIILSIYSMISLMMVAAGQQLLNLSPGSPGNLFDLAAIVISLAIIPVSLTRAIAPAPIQTVKIDLVQVWRLSRVGVVGAFVGGLTTGAFWALAPVYARDVGLQGWNLTFFVSAAVLGGAAFQLPLGRLSDHFDRRLIVLGSSLVGALAAIFIALVSLGGDSTFIPLLLSSFIWGGCTMTLYAICLAHANDSATSESFVMVGSGMLLAVGLSSAVGAPIASMLMANLGPAGLFVYMTVCLFGFAAFILLQRRTDPHPVREDSEIPFHVIAETSPVALVLDPREGSGAEELSGQH